MRTFILTFLLLLASAVSAQVFDSIPVQNPYTIDPYERYIYERPQGYFKDAHGKDVCVAIYKVKSTGKLVRLAVSMETCTQYKPGCEMAFDPATLPELP